MRSYGNVCASNEECRPVGFVMFVGSTQKAHYPVLPKIPGLFSHFLCYCMHGEVYNFFMKLHGMCECALRAIDPVFKTCLRNISINLMHAFNSSTT